MLSISMSSSDLYACSANGLVQRFSPSFDCTASWQAHSGIVLSSIIMPGNPTCLITGGNDDHIKVWELNPPAASDQPVLPAPDSHTSDTLIYALSKFVSIPSVSCSPSNKEDCRQAAIWLKKCLAQLGAKSCLVCCIFCSLIFLRFERADSYRQAKA